MAADSSQQQEQRRSPIEIELEVSEELRLRGNIELALSIDGEVFYETSKQIPETDDNEIDDVEKEIRAPSMKMDEVEDEGPRRRRKIPSSADEIVEEDRGSSDVDVDGRRSAEIDEETNMVIATNTEFHFPTLGDLEHAAQNLAQAVYDDFVHFSYLPTYLRDNEYLVLGHRPVSSSFVSCFKSIFRVHTETVNIWTHMLGCMLFSTIAFYYLTRPHHEIGWEEKMAFTPFFVGIIGCLGMSCAFHIVMSHSEGVARIFNKLDYVGILLLIVGSFVPWLHYGFYCHHRVKLFYLIVVISLGFMCSITILWEKLAHPEYRVLRTSMFAALGLFGVVPYTHVILLNGYHSCTNYLPAMGSMYVIGAVLYAARIPERFCPGRFDIFWHSHQIFHICVVIGAIVHYRGVIEMATIRLGGKWPCDEKFSYGK